MSRHLRSNGLTAVDQEHWWAIQDLNLHSDGLKVRCVTITPMTHMEGYNGLEPSPAAWRAAMLTINTNTPWRYVPDLNRCHSNTNAVYLTNYTNAP